MFYVYILKCSDDTYYTGYTTCVQRRLEEHLKGSASKYTRGRLPVEYVYVEKLPEKSQALKREIEIKNLKRKQKEELIQLFQLHKREGT